jgi:hypothetical protein
MKGLGRLAIFTCLSAFVMIVWIVSAHAQGPTIVCQPLSGAAPTIDGTIGAEEWPATPNMTLGAPHYPIDTNFTCVYDAENLYVLVDAVGDATASVGDECLLIFDLPPAHKIVEIWNTGPSVVVHRFDGGSSGQSEMGFDGHRVYEFRIDLGSIGLQRGGAIAFYSPLEAKAGLGGWASMPYDHDSGKDNVFPYDLQDWETGDPGAVELTAVAGYARLYLTTNTVAPALSPVAMICVALLLVAIGMRLAHRRQRRSA